MTSPSTDEALRRLLDDGRERAVAVDPEQARLWDALVAAADGGKRFRPALLMSVHHALGGTQHDAAAQVGAAVELLHTAFLIHDDVIDGDDVRRGRLNVSGTFRATALQQGATPQEATELGLTAAILAGDLALAAAIRAVATCGAPTATTHHLLDLFDAALHTTAAGELADVRLSHDAQAISVPACLTMAEQKTSAYSFVLPLRAGALLAGADERTMARLDAAGRQLGLAFQLVDDLIGVFGDPALSGKSATSDLRTRKRTLLVAHASTTPEWERLDALLGRELTDGELHEARTLLTASGSRRFVEELADTRLDEARAILEDLGLPTDLMGAVVTRPAVFADEAAA